MPGSFWSSPWGWECSGIDWLKARDTAKHPTIRRMVPTADSDLAPTSVLRLRPAFNHHFFFYYLKDKTFPHAALRLCRRSYSEKPRSWRHLKGVCKQDLHPRRSLEGWLVIRGHFSDAPSSSLHSQSPPPGHSTHPRSSLPKGPPFSSLWLYPLLLRLWTLHHTDTQTHRCRSGRHRQ